MKEISLPRSRRVLYTGEKRKAAKVLLPLPIKCYVIRRLLFGVSLMLSRSYRHHAGNLMNCLFMMAPIKFYDSQRLKSEEP